MTFFGIADCFGQSMGRPVAGGEAPPVKATCNCRPQQLKTVVRTYRNMDEVSYQSSQSYIRRPSIRVRSKQTIRFQAFPCNTMAMPHSIPAVRILSWTPQRYPLQSRDYLLLKILTVVLIQLKDKSLLKNKAFVDGKWLFANSGKTFEVTGR